MNSVQFEAFMDQFRIDPSQIKNGNVESTHTSMEPIYRKRGNFNIPNERLKDFYDAYDKFVFIGGNSCYLTERPLKKKGILKFDFDILYKNENGSLSRLYSMDDALFLVHLIQREVNEILQDKLPEYQYSYLFLRPDPYCKKVERNESTEKITYVIKDGIHIMYPNLFIDYKIHHYLRKRVLARCIEANVQDKFHFENSYDDFVDKSVIDHSGWLMYGATKQGVRPYRLTAIYDENMSEIPVSNISKIDLVKEVSIRKVLPECEIDAKVLQELDSSTPKRKMHEALTRTNKRSNNTRESSNPRVLSDVENVERENFDVNLTNQVKRINLKSAFHFSNIYKLVAVLSPQRALQFHDWIHVGLCLHNICDSDACFSIWKAFSRQVFSPQDLDASEKLMDQFAVLDRQRQSAAHAIFERYIGSEQGLEAWESSLLEKWENFKKKDESSLNLGSLKFWAKHDNPEMYDQMIISEIDIMIRDSVHNPSHKKIASILFKKYQGQYICSDYEKGVWYEWHEHCWKRMDGNSSIRRKITGTCSDDNSLIHDFERCKNIVVEEKLQNNPDMIEKKELIEKISAELEPKLKEFAEFRTRYGHNASVPELQKSIKELSTELKNNKDEYDKFIKEVKKMYIRPYDDVIQKMLETTTSIENIVKEAKQEFYDAYFNRKLNSNPFLFLFSNGVFDLEKKLFRNGVPGDYLSLETDTDQMTYREFEGFDVQEIQDVENYFSKVIVDEEKRVFFLTLVASCLEGYNSNNIFPILTGSGSNAKSLTMNFIEECFGKYAGKLNPAFLTQKRNRSNSASPEYYNIVDCRIVSSEESDMTDELNTAIIKEITGNSKITSRTLFQAKMTTKTPQFVPFLICNDLPNIKSMDGGTWRRIVVISFDSKFVDDPTHKNHSHLKNVFQIDRNLKNKMPEWIQPFMFLLIHKYYQIYISNGRNLIIPNSVRATTDKYRDENDILQSFIEVFVENTGNRSDSVKMKELYNCLLIWFRENFQGEKEPTMQAVKKYFESKFGNYDSKGWVGKKLNV